MAKEEWRVVSSIKRCKASSLGRVELNGDILQPYIQSTGYYSLTIYGILHLVHQLVAIAFHNHIPNGHKLVVDHIDFNKLNNRADNIRVISNRENTNRKHLKSSSVYTGVSWFKPSNSWRSQVRVNGKQIHLGLYDKEEDAHKAYQNALKNV